MKNAQEFFPDGTVVDEWFYHTDIPQLADLGKQYVLTDYQIYDDGEVYTEKIQELIDNAAGQGGGVIVVPPGTYMTGALRFTQGVHLYIAEGGVLKGSDDISDYPVCMTRMEGESCQYFAALINVDNVDGFTMMGEGTIDGNGWKAWKAFWLRRAWNPQCTNKDEQRARLIYISNSSNVLVAGLHLQNAQFWTNHLYKSHHIKYINCSIYSPAAPVKAPSTDAIDIDACTDILIKDCYMEVNDDAVVLKGGKGPWADEKEENGANERVIIEDCRYGFCHGCLTLGSESVHNRNIIMRRIQAAEANNLLWLKLRPDTPQHYEYVLVEDIECRVVNFLNINPWKQFFDLKGRTDMPVSLVEHVTMQNCICKCQTCYCVTPKDDQYLLSDFVFENNKVDAKRIGCERFIMA